ncbi:MAG: hypothetical protein ACK4OH_17160 [Acidovorax temperans]|uniref:hypothetical protein n=1 Tax=Acidovorax temperans TaxID=80878 RepID=UPI00391AC731
MGAAVGVVGSALMGGGAMSMGGLLGGIGSQFLSSMVGGLLGGNDMSKTLEGFSPVNILNATTNLVSTIMGGGAQQAAQTLQREDGMPKFLQDAISQAIEQVMQEYCKPTDGAGEAIADVASCDIQKSVDDIAQQIVDSVRNQMAESTGEGGGKGCGKAGAKSWLQAIAQAMGEAMGDKAAKMVELSGKLKEAAGGEGEDSAKEMQAVNAEFQAVSQEFKLLTDAFNTALKSLGEGMSSMARKQ